jgi:hypothetical protein
MMTKHPVKRATRKLQLTVLTKVFYLSYATLRSINMMVLLREHCLCAAWGMAAGHGCSISHYTNQETVADGKSVLQSWFIIKMWSFQVETGYQWQSCQ